MYFILMGFLLMIRLRFAFFFSAGVTCSAALLLFCSFYGPLHWVSFCGKYPGSPFYTTRTVYYIRIFSTSLIFQNLVYDVVNFLPPSISPAPKSLRNQLTKTLFMQSNGWFAWWFSSYIIWYSTVAYLCNTDYIMMLLLRYYCILRIVVHD